MKEITQGIRDGIPIALGYLSVSFTFGLMAVEAGLTWWQAVLISAANLTSAGQFAGLDIMAAGGAMFEMALTQLVINMRYALMSLSLSQKVDSSVHMRHRFIIGFAVTDEIFAVAMSRDKKVSRFYMYGLMLCPFLGWTSGTALGAVLGNILPEFVRNSLGIAIYGMFIAIIVPKAKKEAQYLKVILIAVFLSCCFAWIPFLKAVSSGFVVIICAVLAAGAGAYFFPIQPEAEEDRLSAVKEGEL